MEPFITPWSNILESNLFKEQFKEAGGRQVSIMNKTYTIKLLPTSAGLRVFNRLVKVLAPALGIILDSPNEEEILLPEDNQLFTGIAVALVRQLDELNPEETVRDLVSTASCGGQPIDFENHFSGKYGELMILVEYILKENFRDLFTVYLKEKGLGVPTLGDMMTKSKAIMSAESES